MADKMIRVLKIGLVQEGQLIEESILKQAQGLSIGSEKGNTLNFTDKGIPRRHQLIEYSPEGYKLNLLPEMSGKLFIDNQTVDINSLISSGKAARTDKGYEFSIKGDTKGKISIANSTVLFQLVPPPAVVGPVKLPKEIRGGFLNNIDLIFLAMLVVSALLHTGFVAYLKSIPFSEEEVLNVEAEKFVGQLKDEDIIVEKKEEEPEKGDEGNKKKGGGGGKAGPKSPVAVESKGVLMLLSSAKGKGAVDDLLSNSGLGSQLSNALGSISGVKVGNAGDAGLGAGTKGGGIGPGSGSGTDIGDIGSVGSGGTTGTGNRTEKKVTAKLATAGGGVTGKIDAEKVRGYIRNQLGGVRHCYEMQLNVNANLQGKVKVMFTIDSSGSVASCAITENTMGNTLVSDCVCRRVERWRFPPPDEGNVTVSYTFIFTPAE